MEHFPSEKNGGYHFLTVSVNTEYKIGSFLVTMETEQT